MTDHSFELLEEKVMTAVRRIQTLKSENEVLVKRRAELEGEIESLKDKVDRTERELAEVRDQAASVETFQAKSRAIEEKVGGLLQTLESID